MTISCRPSVIHIIILIFLLGAGLGARIDNIRKQPLLRFYGIRSYHAANVARAYYYRFSEGIQKISKWKKDLADLNAERGWHLEPPVMETMAAFLYTLIGKERLWIPRILSAFFWALGGLFLFLICISEFSASAAIFCTAFYLFLPFGILASSTFQPDSLMVMTAVASIFFTLSYFNAPSDARLWTAVGISALSFFVKPMSFFIVTAVFFSQLFYSDGNMRLLRNRFIPTALYTASLIPMGLYYAHLVFFEHHELSWQVKASFQPDLFFQKAFWISSMEKIHEVFSYRMFLLALFGVFISQGRWKRLLKALWVSYILFFLVFNFHVYTHTYYHLPYIPVVAMSLAPVFQILILRCGRIFGLFSRKALLFLMIPGLFFFCARQTEKLALKTDHALPLRFYTAMSEESYQAMSQEIGAFVNHSPNVVALDPQQCEEALKYYGRLGAFHWPTSTDFKYLTGLTPALPASERFKRYLGADYFVILDKEEFQRQSDLKELLLEKFPILAEKNSYIIFNLKK